MLSSSAPCVAIISTVRMTHHAMAQALTRGILRSRVKRDDVKIVWQASHSLHSQKCLKAARWPNRIQASTAQRSGEQPLICDEPAGGLGSLARCASDQEDVPF